MNCSVKSQGAVAPVMDDMAPVDFAVLEPGETLDEDASLKPTADEVTPPTVSSRFVTLVWAEPLSDRSGKGLRLSVMRAVARLKAAGVPVLRWHSDRAKEYSTRLLSEWLSGQGIHQSRSAPEDHAANGRAEVAVREIKRAARKNLIASGLGSKYRPLAVRQAGEQSWRRAMQHLGAPERPLLPFGTKVQAKNREWKKRDNKAWGPRTIGGRLVGPAPLTLGGYIVLLEDHSLYVSASVHPLPSEQPPPVAPKPKFRHTSKAPLGSIRVLLVPAGGESPDVWKNSDTKVVGFPGSQEDVETKALQAGQQGHSMEVEKIRMLKVSGAATAEVPEVPGAANVVVPEVSGATGVVVPEVPGAASVVVPEVSGAASVVFQVPQASLSCQRFQVPQALSCQIYQVPQASLSCQRFQVPQALSCQRFQVPQASSCQRFQVPQALSCQRYQVPLALSCQRYQVPQASLSCHSFQVPLALSCQRFQVPQALSCQRFQDRRCRARGSRCYQRGRRVAELSRRSNHSSGKGKSFNNVKSTGCARLAPSECRRIARHIAIFAVARTAKDSRFLGSRSTRIR